MPNKKEEFSVPAIAVIIVLLIIAFVITASYTDKKDAKNESDVSSLKEDELTSKATDKEELIEAVTPMTEEEVSKVAKMKEKLSPSEIKRVEALIAEKASDQKLSEAELQIIEWREVYSLLKSKIIKTYEADSSNKAPYYQFDPRDSEQDFYLKLISFYSQDAHKETDGGVEANKAMKDIIDKDGIDVLTVSNIQEVYKEHKEAPTGAYEMVLSYYKDQSSSTPTALELRNITKQAISDDFISVAEFNKITDLREKYKKETALAGIKKAVR